MIPHGVEIYMALQPIDLQSSVMRSWEASFVRYRWFPAVAVLIGTAGNASFVTSKRHSPPK